MTPRPYQFDRWPWLALYALGAVVVVVSRAGAL